MATLESTSVQPVLEIPSDLDAPGAEEGVDSSLSAEDSRWDAHFAPLYALHEDVLWDDAENILPANAAATHGQAVIRCTLRSFSLHSVFA
jgi:hypothetical protein